VLQVSERRFTAEAGSGVDVGKLFGRDAGRFSRIDAYLTGHWFPQAAGSDYETRVEFRGGAAGGALPLDEHFQLGVERDTALWLRGHAGTRSGRKGSALIGRRYFLTTMECFKLVRDTGLFSIHAGPFVDVSRIRDVLGRYPGKTWFADPGAQIRVRVLGLVGARISYSRGVVYAAVER
jgi:hypothetical protein